ncbi:hypothetical protein Bealeia1_01511 [Candidatus Bealeia paramacronuclearis]|uniref:Uncharacterized protein n=1 Tax=Candidatus Bealeia paramacronuclearis TaxID=1921001 RepID=A0ABZ2C541_9PROT|nr:hypothetical protein [Candidatus Bealeia paramacronuclearis]
MPIEVPPSTLLKSFQEYNYTDLIKKSDRKNILEGTLVRLGGATSLADYIVKKKLVNAQIRDSFLYPSKNETEKPS